jgi:hypothetical protein
MAYDYPRDFGTNGTGETRHGADRVRAATGVRVRNGGRWRDRAAAGERPV